MKLNRILAGMSAAAMAASMLTMVTASAAAKPATITGDHTFVSNKEGTATDGFVKEMYHADYSFSPEDTIYVKVESTSDADTSAWQIAVNAYDTSWGGWSAVNGDEGALEFTTTVADVVAVNSSIKEDLSNLQGINVEVWNTEVDDTISYEISINGGASEDDSSTVDSEYPEDAVFANGGTSWSGVEFDSVKEIAFGAWDGIWLQCDYPKEGMNVADETNAKLVLVLEADETVTAGSAIFRVGDTTDETPHAYLAEADGTTFTVEIPITELKAFQDAAGYAAVDSWDNGFACNLQVGAAGKVTAYVTGMAYTPLEDSTDDSSDTETEVSYTAFEMFTDSQWGWGNWDPVADGGLGTDAEITGDGTYTVSISADQVAKWYDEEGNEVLAGTEGATPAPAVGIGTWCVDIRGLADALGVGTDGLGKDLTATDKMNVAKEGGLTITDVNLIVDGETVYTYDDADVLFGDIEGNGNVRLEIYNQYGETGGSDGKADPTAPAEILALATDLVAEDEIAVTFTVNGLPEELPEPVESSDDANDSTADSTDDSAASATDSDATSSKGDASGSDANPSTGAAALATVGVLLAGAAVVATKKK
ncbi:NPXTG-anchored protein [Ruminococcus sp. Marseille-P6503]|uniref:NPXTG-anchored protein n=1 Tax=Ruminococcus sp. Marseille-P6503 TaxID=2364796 RepID=UPI000F5401F8|nr:NPXTG-anchored protein [Ruminococcus sp. Marseille-P6503]